MFWLFYNTLLFLGFPVIISLLLSKKRSQRGILARLGKVPTRLKKLSSPVVWIHAASLGEVTAVVPLLKIIKEADPRHELIVSTVTETGREMVLTRLQGIATHCYAPIDMWWAVTRYVRVLQPRLFLLVESEFWPNLLTSLQEHKVPVCLVNGRISSTSFSRYRLVNRLMKTVWASIDLALMQTDCDAARLRELGAQANSVYVTGNMKFDHSLERRRKGDSPTDLRISLGITGKERVIVAGSTHPGEEEYLLEAYKMLSATQQHLVLILAPRHIERASALEKVITSYGLICVRRSVMRRKFLVDNYVSPRVILLDTRGELPYVYGLGIFGFVGGTLVPVGGHNLLEPAQWGRPVLFGPYVDHCRDIAHQLLEFGGALQVSQPEVVRESFLRLLTHPMEADQMGRHALSVIRRNRGVVEKNHRMICQLMESDPTAMGLSQARPNDSVQHSSCKESCSDFSAIGSA